MTPSSQRHTQVFLRLAAMVTLAGCHLMPAQAVPPAPAERLTFIQPAQLTRLKARLDPKLISPTAKILYTQPKQSFRLLRGEEEINLVSIVFEDPHPSQGSSIGGCGVYLIPPNGLIQFFNPLDGQGETPYGCADIAAVRLHRIPGGKPVFEFTADMSAGAHSFLQTFTVRWDPRVGRYTMDTVDFK